MRRPYGPYPYKMGRDPEEVSEEDAKVTVLDAENPIFNWPNKITAAISTTGSKSAAQNGWGDWDERYKPLLESQRPRAATTARRHGAGTGTGAGTFTYAAYAFYRQLPAGVPGAYRLFANLISLGKSNRNQMMTAFRRNIRLITHSV